ncbi:uncharacterized protein IUM83_04959 [Phytophthora cinnamomi]|uniref:uncharacterized protein n=1 Tax=Phytophthora cinnamomi TaxID=4785 RepID=UPI00355A4E6E|nr:hypothetical protein IUM83_04959 [Phytophthora cinnamomi]
MEEPPIADACSVTIADGIGEQETGSNTTNVVVEADEINAQNAGSNTTTVNDEAGGIGEHDVGSNAINAIVEVAVGTLSAKAMRLRRLRDIMDQKAKRDSNCLVSVTDKGAEADDSKLKMIIEDVIAALEFDYYVLGVAL